MYVSRYQPSSLISAAADWPPTVAKRMSGYIVGEWLPHTTSFSIESTGLPARAASCERARLWSSRIIAVKALFGSDGADFMAM